MATMERLAHMLEATVGGGEAVRSATAALEEEQQRSGFGSQLLALSAVTPVAKYSLPAATYFKNYVWTKRSQEGRGTGIPEAERTAVRSQLLEVVMRADGQVLKQLAEALRVLVLQDFRDAGDWPELLPSVRSAIQHSNLIGGMHDSSIKTYNALVAVHTLTKAFQYFQKPSEINEAVPPQLEAIAQQLLEPLQSIYQSLVQQALATHEAGLAEHDALLHLLLKAFHHSVRSHLPAALVPQLGCWLGGTLALVALPVLTVHDPQPGHVMRCKVVKRCLHICASLVARHRKQADKYLQQMVTAAVAIATAATTQQGLAPIQSRVVSLAFDLLAAILETGPGWRLLCPHFEALLSQAIFPALALQDQDVSEWQDDPTSYITKNLPDDMDDVSGWRDDLHSPRRSAQNLMGLIALAKVAGPSRPVRKAAKRPLRTAAEATAGEAIVLPALAHHAIPAGTQQTDIARYYGVLHAYAALQKFYSQAQKPGSAVAMLRARVLPLYAQSSPSPLLVATANWLLGEYAEDLATAGDAPGLAGDTLRAHVFDVLLKGLAFPDGDDCDAGPVRLSAAGAMQALMQAGFHPPEWLPLLQSVVAASRSDDDDEAARAFQLLQTAAESADPQVAQHAPALLPVLTSAVMERLPEERSAPWPAVADAGTAAMTSLVTAFDDAEQEQEEEDEEEEKEEAAAPTWVPTPAEQSAVAERIAGFLQRAWLPSLDSTEAAEEQPTDSSLHDASLLLAHLLKHSCDRAAIDARRVEALLGAWSGLLRGWDAWTSEEDSAALAVIDAAIEKQKACLLPHFISAPIPSAPLPPVAPQSPLEAIAGFLTDAIETARAEGAWRACYRVHSLLHATANAFEGHEATKAVVHRVAVACASRLQQQSSPSAPLAKPLVLAIATCFLANSTSTSPALAAALGAHGEDARGMEAQAGVAEWAVRLAEVVKRDEHGLTDATECHLAGAALVSVVDALAAAGGGAAEAGVAGAALEGAMRALLRETELREGDSGMEEEEDDEGEEEDDDEEDDEEEGDEDDGSDQQETEAEFLERYAAAARELEDGDDTRDGGEEEDGQPLELGILALASLETTLLNSLQGRRKLTMDAAAALDPELVQTFIASVPNAARFLRH